MLLSPLLQEYLIENGNLPLPATGRLTIQHTPAYLNDTNETVIAPNSKIVFSDTVPAESELQQLIMFIAGKLNISNKESERLLEKELGLNAALKESASVSWPEWNLFQNKKDDTLPDPSQSALNQYLPSFATEKIVRQPVTPTEVTTETVTLPIEPVPEVVTEPVSEEVFTDLEEPVAKDHWWVWALIIFGVSILLILFRYA